MIIDAFAAELKLIKSIPVRNFVGQCLENAPKYFWEIPSSNTGKYHPKDEFVRGGLVLHTKRVVAVANEICECINLSDGDKDCVIAAAILHDVCKNGYPENTGNTIDGHGFYFSIMARTFLTKNDFLQKESFQIISRLVLTHMGKYDLPYVIDWNDKLAAIVHISDYIASRENILIGVKNVGTCKEIN